MMARVIGVASLSVALAAGRVGAGDFSFGELVLSVPEGFAVERVAAPPMVVYPICADFDNAGRLYVAESSGSNAKVEDQLEEKPHRILRLEDSDGDGSFDRSVVFADGMMIPQGILWHDGAVYCAAPPVIWKLVDTDGDGVADERSVWFDGKTLTGCANDLHGPYGGPDGFLYWCKGGFAQQDYVIDGRRDLSDRAAHIFRMRPDGSGFDEFLAGGMDNPVEIAWTRTGDPIFTTTFFNHPQGGKRDALVHGLYGGVYPKPHGVIDGLPRTGDLLPPMTHLGPAAPCGLVSYESVAFGHGYRGNLFACQFNLHSVTRHQLVPDGSTYRTEDSDFVTSESPDFHPTDVLQDRDGSLLVIDTGGWYKLCCPTSQIAKPDVPGAIYRIRKSTPDPEAIPTAEDARIAEIWKWAQRGDPPSVEALRDALTTGGENVIRVALHAVGICRDPAAVPHVLRHLESGSPAVRRSAATALAQIRDASAVPHLMAAAGIPGDRALDHALIHALIEIGDPDATARGLGAEAPGTWRAALVALDQMDGREASEAELQAALLSTGEAVSEAALWIYERHPGRGGELVAFLGEQIAGGAATDDLKRMLARFSRNDEVLDSMAAALRSGATPTEMKRAILEAPARRDDAPENWREAVAASLGVAALTEAAIGAAEASGGAHYEAELLEIALDASREIPLRVAALAAIDPLPEPLDARLFDLLASEDSLAAARVLGGAALTDSQRDVVLGMLAGAGPIELPHLLKVVQQAGGNDSQGVRLLDALSAAPARAALGEEAMDEAFARFPEETRARARALARTFRPGWDVQSQRLAEMEAAMPVGDRDRGHVVFNSQKAACLSCHSIGYRGGELGPDLSRIGSVRTERDLLEAIVFPSASFARGYEPVLVGTRDAGHVLGMVRDQDGKTMTLATAPGLEVSVAEEDIASIDPAPVSLMPPGLDQIVSPQELADLIAFLRSLR
ncbi:hypothetical protein BH23VER1_BH23VER1_06800 [soil metagenome]